MKVLLIFLLISIISSDQVSDILQNIKNSPRYPTKKEEILIMCEILLREGYPIAFTAGIVANMIQENNFGKFESSKYRDPSERPQYLKYMDELYYYRIRYSEKSVTEVSLRELKRLLEKLESDNWKKGKFGLGSLQWSEGRALHLVDHYNKQCNNRDKITKDEVTAAETNMIFEELNNTYNNIYLSWEKEYPNKDGISAAYKAGYMICVLYVKSSDSIKKSPQMGKHSVQVYDMMNGK